MPHLHTQPHGHDVTISAWILRQFPSDGVRRRQWKALVHKHRLMHPTPVLLNTHSPYPGHFHSDIVMAMVAHGDPAEKPRPGESQELQWVSPDEFAALPGAEPDAVMIMTMIVERVADSWLAIPATRWSLADAPAEAMTDRSVAEATAPDPLDDRETLGWGTAQ